MATAATQPPPTASIVIELDNSSFVSSDQAMENIGNVLDHIRETPEAQVGEVIVAYRGDEQGSGPKRTESLRAQFGSRADGIALTAVPVAGGRYYELKNAGAEVASSELVVFMDSDCEPMTGWLRTLLAPFGDPTTVAAHGHTSFGTDSFVARAMALCWVFPPPGSPLSEACLVSNNLAFRARWFRNNPFPVNDGFKTSGEELLIRMREQGHDVIPVDARVTHAFWTTSTRGLMWRAGIAGRDGARKVRARGVGPAGGAIAAAVRWARSMRHVAVRGSRYGTKVGLPAWQVPGALALGAGFWTLACAWQAASAIGLVRERREEIPTYVDVS